ncbi:unnamed protein product [Rangifer tarandus platyrhynchus]|uniref:Uncharacterized protein n=1 Tax=Rangifer tarandus platyrhynchus TaxID=3082113 RepID=A0ABN8Z083_RANTA|nr:unnamed protein product [Rangifer tarandus platyrhynchus]
MSGDILILMTGGRGDIGIKWEWGEARGAALASVVRRTAPRQSSTWPECQCAEGEKHWLTHNLAFREGVGGAGKSRGGNHFRGLSFLVLVREEVGEGEAFPSQSEHTHTHWKIFFGICF